MTRDVDRPTLAAIAVDAFALANVVVPYLAGGILYVAAGLFESGRPAPGHLGPGIRF